MANYDTAPCAWIDDDTGKEIPFYNNTKPFKVLGAMFTMNGGGADRFKDMMSKVKAN